MEKVSFAQVVSDVNIQLLWKRWLRAHSLLFATCGVVHRRDHGGWFETISISQPTTHQASRVRTSQLVPLRPCVRTVAPTRSRHS